MEDEKRKNSKKYCGKCLTPTCRVEHKILSKEHASKLIMQEICILQTSNKPKSNLTNKYAITTNKFYMQLCLV